MRDVFWTIIVIWLVYQLVNIFKGSGQKKKYAFHNNDAQQESKTSSTILKKDVKTAIKKHADNEGEYVDYEELK